MGGLSGERGLNMPGPVCSDDCGLNMAIESLSDTIRRIDDVSNIPGSYGGTGAGVGGGQSGGLMMIMDGDVFIMPVDVFWQDELRTHLTELWEWDDDDAGDAVHGHMQGTVLNDRGSIARNTTNNLIRDQVGQFDGANDFHDIPLDLIDLDGADGFTIGGWLRPAIDNSRMWQWSMNSDANGYMHGTYFSDLGPYVGAVLTDSAGGNKELTTNPNVYAVNTWYFVVLRYRGDTNKGCDLTVISSASAWADRWTDSDTLADTIETTIEYSNLACQGGNPEGEFFNGLLGDHFYAGGYLNDPTLEWLFNDGAGRPAI